MLGETSANRPYAFEGMFSRLSESEAPLVYFHHPAGAPVTAVSGCELCAEAMRWSRLLGQRGERVVPIFGRSTRAMLAAWLGAVHAGKLPVFIAFPSRKITPSDYAIKLANYQREFGATVFVGESRDRSNGTDVLVPADLDGAGLAELEPTPAAADDAAPLFLQCSSGSTGLQKTVAITRVQLDAQISACARSIQLDPESDRIVSWLPLYHDMGLIACFLLPLLTRTPVHCVDTFEWAANPASLLELIEQTRSTLVWLPNFAFSLLCRFRPGHDLRSMRAFINCSEPVSASGMTKFAAHHGIEPGALATSYALAENVFAVSQSLPGRAPGVVGVDRGAIATNRVVVKTRSSIADLRDANGPDTYPFTSCGRVVDGVDVRIDAVDEHTLGEVMIRGVCTLDGYFGKDSALVDGWFPTGDVGFVLDEELYICGRKKDVIILNGKNIYPQDVEAILDEHPAVHAGRTVAIGWRDNRLGSEQLSALFEPDRSITRVEKSRICEELRLRVGALLDIDADVFCVPPRWLKKTSSGKIARLANLEHLRACRDRHVYICGDSHVRMFWTTPNSHRNAYRQISARWLGVMWADNCSQFLGHIESLCARLRPGDVLVIEAGEPECRTIFPQAPHPERRIAQSVQGYAGFLQSIRGFWPGELAFMTGIPTHPQNIDNGNPQWAIRGDPQERYAYQRTFYEQMKLLCRSLHLSFIDVCTPLLSESGLMDPRRLYDAAHLHPAHLGLYFDLMDEAFGFVDDLPAPPHDIAPTWDGSYEDFVRRASYALRGLVRGTLAPDYEHLVSSGALDSLGLVEFISILERDFGFAIDLNRVGREDFESLSRLYERFAPTARERGERARDG